MIRAIRPLSFHRLFLISRLKGGTLTYALENESPFTGIFSAEIADTSPDSEAAAPGDEPLFDINDHYQITNKEQQA